MATAQGSVIQLYGSNVATAEPLAENLANDAKGVEIAINTADRKLYAKNANNITVSLGGAVGGGSDQVFILNQQRVTQNYTIPDGYNASSTGTIVQDAGVVVTIPTGSRWAII